MKSYTKWKDWKANQFGFYKGYLDKNVNYETRGAKELYGILTHGFRKQVRMPEGF